MSKKMISVTEAARNFADCVNCAHYQNMTFILVKNGLPVARLAPQPNDARFTNAIFQTLAFTDVGDRSVASIELANILAAPFLNRTSPGVSTEILWALNRFFA
jgi:hypothetical protein